MRKLSLRQKQFIDSKWQICDSESTEGNDNSNNNNRHLVLLSINEEQYMQESHEQKKTSSTACDSAEAVTHGALKVTQQVRITLDFSIRASE